MQEIFSFYHYSPKRVRELERVAESLEQSLSHFGGIQNIRWVASQRKALQALIRNYPATCSHLQMIAETSSCDSSKAIGLLRRLRSPKFLTLLHFMMDFTEVIGRLSEVFQADDLLMMEVIPSVESAMLALVEMKASPGSNVSSLSTGDMYCGISLSGKVQPVLDQLHIGLLDSGIEYIDSRFSALQAPPLSDFSVLDYRQWPYHREELVHYGKPSIQRPVQQFAPVLTAEEVYPASREWLDFKLIVSKLRTSCPRDVYRDMLILPPRTIQHFLPLIEIMLSFSMSTAIVERCFSSMNVVKAERRTHLGNDTLNDLLEIKINGPSLADFIPEEAISHWMNKGKGTRYVNGHKC